ncbi:MAG: hypothetical protein AB7K35_14710 [Pseudorhodoplanes sp.]
MSYDPQSINRAREMSQSRELAGFNYDAGAELFPSRNRKMRGPAAYKRFDNAAEAIRFAVEQLPEPALRGAYLEVNETRYGHQEILYLYAHDRYPLKRLAKAS